jgi:hypothetical protein
MKTLVLFLLCSLALFSASPLNNNSGNGYMGGVGAPNDNYCTMCKGGLISLKGYSGPSSIQDLICKGRNSGNRESILAISSKKKGCSCETLW